MISEHSAHLTPLSVDFRTWLWRYTYLLLLISMLWHRQALFKSNWDKLCSSAECWIWTRGLRHQIASRLNARWQTDWAIEDQAKKLELDSPSLWSASIQPTWPHCQSCVPLLNEGLEPWVSDTKLAADWMLADKPTELSRIKLKIFNSTARPYDQRAFSPLDPTVSWLSHLALAIYIFVVVNFDALAQARVI